jgi:hypothetical protein
MTIGIYALVHKRTGKRFIDKSLNVTFHSKNHISEVFVDHNDDHYAKYFYEAVQKSGPFAFKFEILETFSYVNEEALVHRYNYWIDHFNTDDVNHGYNWKRRT